MRKLMLGVLFGLFAGLGPALAAGANHSDSRIALHQGWTLQSSAQVKEGGEALSTPGFDAKGWYPTTVPSTVLAALVQNKVYPDPYFGMNLRSVPGTGYPIGSNFANLEMPKDSPFTVPWWYRTEFRLPKSEHGKRLWLHFDGLNYRANIWLNGKQIADAQKVVGMWRLYEFDVTDLAKPGQANALAVEVFAPKSDDLAITFVDWNPLPSDKDMGLWRDVFLTSSGPVTVRYPQVITHFDLPSLAVAHLTVNAELHNATGQAVKGALKARIENTKLTQEVELAAGETKTVSFTPAQYPELNFQNPRVWWPAKLGPQNLYPLQVEFETGRKVSDREEIQFGIREVTSELTPENYQLFKVNGHNILIRGGGWSPDMMLREDPARMEDEIRYSLGMNLNTIRLEGKLETEHFFELCDRYGVLVQAGWCCCDFWERWHRWKPESYTVAYESLKDQIRRLRSHACLFDWLNGSDNPPIAEVEKNYVKILADNNWPNPYQSSATEKTTSVTGHSGMKMEGPYEWVPPVYWLSAHKPSGAAFGYATEISPGPAIPPVESLKMMLPADHLWPIDPFWDYHAGGGAFKNVQVFTEALNQRYGEATSLEDYAGKAQLMAYEGERAMFEGYGRNKYKSTGVIQWMLNNAWPSIIWHLYDYYLRPGGGYFGTQKACEPLHVQYSDDDRFIVVVNSYYQAFGKMKVGAEVLNLDLASQYSNSAVADIPPDSATRVFTVPELKGLSSTYFLRLKLTDAEGKLMSSNFYWLSTKPDVLDWQKSKWYYTPQASYADLTALKTLPSSDVNLSGHVAAAGDDQVAHVTVTNPGSHLAFFVHLKLAKGQGGEEVLPALWSDNYFELMPGETREVTATIHREALAGASPVVEADGWNVVPKSASLESKSAYSESR